MEMATKSIDDLESVLTSRVITFLVGPDKKAFHVNEKLVVSCSEIFKKMLTNGMRESQEGVVELDEHEPRVFTSFINYTIYGNYEVPIARGKHKSATGDMDEELLVVPDSEYDSLSDHVLKQATLLADSRRSVPYVQYMESFVHQGDTGKLYGKPPRLLANERPDLEANFDLMVANRQFGEICTHHVKLYIFADKYDIAELRQLCLHRLHCSLVRAKLGDTGYKLLFDAIAFTFENTLPGDKIRKLFVQTCVADFSLVRLMPFYKDLCYQVPEVVYEIMVELPKYWDTHRNALIDVASKFTEE
ncbi:hypothetical protein ColLi_01255 [Colletotrichum liriopes]|uniref:BTB domain-containing protein n=1 Tax=Colletotrichum liriopes TaxID=708192 RepID=A0AA37LNR7_9PEZI|nr:hypothetical protein ColLi_01255 [Colletotrichum liriopes]